MNYEQFVQEMESCTKGKAQDEEVAVQRVRKNNGVIYVGLTIRKEGEAAVPLVYLEPYYQKYLQGISVEELSDLLLSQVRNTSAILPWDYREILDFQKIKRRIVYRLVNAEKNKALLNEIPNLPILDFAIIFYIHISGGEKGSASVLIRNSNLEFWKCPISLLYQYAKENTQKIFPYEFGPIQNYMRDAVCLSGEEYPLFLLSNVQFLDGAAVLLYPGMPQIIYEAVGGNYYLLPSSVHEFLVVPESDCIIPERLRKMVKTVNRSQVDEEEFLSDHIYYFNGEIITKM